MTFLLILLSLFLGFVLGGGYGMNSVKQMVKSGEPIIVDKEVYRSKKEYLIIITHRKVV